MEARRMTPPEQTLTMTAALAETQPDPLPDESAPPQEEQKQTYQEMFAVLKPVLPAEVKEFLKYADGKTPQDSGYSPMRVAAGLEMLAEMAEHNELGLSLGGSGRTRTEDFRGTSQLGVYRQDRFTSAAPSMLYRHPADRKRALCSGEKLSFEAVVQAYSQYAEHVTPKDAADEFRYVMNETHPEADGATVVQVMQQRLEELAKPIREELRSVSVATGKIPPTAATTLRYMAKKVMDLEKPAV
jgi:hypothetical protein